MAIPYARAIAAAGNGGVVARADEAARPTPFPTWAHRHDFAAPPAERPRQEPGAK